MKRTITTTIIMLSLLLGCTLWSVGRGGKVAHAAPAVPVTTFTVTNTNSAGPGSLRNAIIFSSPGDTINFNLPNCPCTITLENFELVIDHDLTINGPGANLLTISGNNQLRVFFINRGAPGATTGPPATSPVVNISNLTIANGKAQGGNGGEGLLFSSTSGGGGAAGMGGAIFVNGAVAIINGVEFRQNSATGGLGGNDEVSVSTNDLSGSGGGVGSNGSRGVGGNGGSLGGFGGPAANGAFGDGAPGGEGAGGSGGCVTAGAGGFGGGGGGANCIGLGVQGGGRGGFGGGAGGSPTIVGQGGRFGGNSGVGIGQASGGGGAGLGGAIFIRAGSLNLSNSGFTNNSATSGLGGPGASNGQGKGGAIFICKSTDDPTCSATATGSNNSFGGNIAAQAAGTGSDNNNVYGGSCDGNTIISPASLPNGTVGTAYNQLLTSSNGGAFYLTSGVLPFGLTLGANGLLSGTPTSGGGFTFTVFGSSSGFTGGCQTYTVNIVPGSCDPAPAGLTSWWRAEGNANDAVGSNHGTVQLSATTAAGHAGQAFKFDGTNGYVALPDNLFPFPTTGTGTTPFSFELWFKSAASGGVILGQQDVAPYNTPSGAIPAIYVGTDGKLRVEMFWNGAINPLVSANSVNDNAAFHHVAVIYDGTNETVYLDGAAMGSRAHTQTAYSASYKYQLGTGMTSGWPGGNGGWFNFTGLIDEPSLYNRALSAAEVQAIFAAGNAGKCFNTAPGITAASVTRTSSNPASNSQIATVQDAQDAATSLTVTATPLTGTGVTLNGISVDATGNVTANVAASCSATTSTFTLRVTDSGGLFSESTLTVTVTANPSPTLGAYPATSVVVGGTATVTPAAPPADNISVTGVTVSAPGFTGTISVNATTGVVTIGNAGPAGGFTVSVTAADSCGAQAVQTFPLTITANTCGITINPATLPQAYIAVPYVRLLSATPQGSYTFSVSAGQLPPGLQLVTVLGVSSIAGLPATPGTYGFTIKAKRNNSTCEATRGYTVTIPATVAPILNCVMRNANGSYTAKFGYNNSTGAAVTIPVGANNYFTPGNQNRGQTTTFQPGVVTNAFSVTFAANGSNLGIWFLKGPDGVLRPVNVLTTSIGCP